jgi:hypothetical protein
MALPKTYKKMEIVILAAVLILNLILLYNKIFKKDIQQDDEVTLNIKDLTLNVKDQLEKIDSVREKKNEFPLFKVESFDLELNFIIKKTNSNSAKFENELITISNGQDYAKEQVQKIVLHMKTNADSERTAPINNEKE